MELERIKEMKDAVSESIHVALKQRMAQIMVNYETEKDNLIIIGENLRELAGMRTGSFTISYLRTSFITKNHKFKMTFYVEEVYVEENPDGFFHSMNNLFMGIEEDIIYFTALLKKQFIRVFASEIEEIRRYYMELVYVGCEKIFRQLILDVGNNTDREVYYGEYMGKTMLIGML